jgi:hypothetical protein
MEGKDGPLIATECLQSQDLTIKFERIKCRRPLPVVLTENSNLKLYSKYNLQDITVSEHLKCLGVQC